MTHAAVASLAVSILVVLAVLFYREQTNCVNTINHSNICWKGR